MNIQTRLLLLLFATAMFFSAMLQFRDETYMESFVYLMLGVCLTALSTYQGTEKKGKD